MALVTPILYSQVAFDAENMQIFLFDVTGGSQVTANRLTIINQSSGSVVYQDKQISYAFSHILPAGTLTNGVYYSAYLNTYDSSDNISSNSNLIQFYCYTTPSYDITNIPVGNVISNSSYNFIATYNQDEEEQLNSYEFNLYDSQQILIATSGIKYAELGELPIDVSYQFSGLLENNTYYIEALGETVEGTQVSTVKLPFTVKYVDPSAYSAIELTNNCKDGYIILRSNLTAIKGETNPTPPIYVYDNNAISLVSNGSYVKWYEGFIINSNFTASLWGDNLKIDTRVASMEDSNGNILNVYFIKKANYYYAHLKVKSNNVTYLIYSEPITLTDETVPIQIWFRRIDNLFDVGIVELE